ADAERRDCADVLSSRRGPQDHAHQHPGEGNLHQQRLPVRVARAWQRGSEMLDVAEDRIDKQASQGCTDELDEDVPRKALPRKVSAKCKRERYDGVQMRA